jgi:hypothetical protein
VRIAYPTAFGLADAAHVFEHRTNAVGWFTRKSVNPGCALCREGVCIQRFSLEAEDDDCMVVHGVLGQS